MLSFKSSSKLYLLVPLMLIIMDMIIFTNEFLKLTQMELAWESLLSQMAIMVEI